MNKDKFIKIALIVAIILLMILVYLSFIDKTKIVKNPYYAVYLQTGDMYFGRLSRFPKLILSDVWFLQASVEEQGGVDLIKYSNAIFGPEDKIEINKENVVWISKLRDDSQVVISIQQNQGAALQSTQPQVVPQETLPMIEE
ncbi:MAG: hypothetical protein WC288_01700 [Candidatus Paceibacterota bacterium]|jgi:hypothetical protein